jgi:hypothetical protein
MAPNCPIEGFVAANPRILQDVVAMFNAQLCFVADIGQPDSGHFKTSQPMGVNLPEFEP